MKKQNILQKMTSVVFAAFLLAIGIFALPGFVAQTAYAAAAPEIEVGLIDGSDDLDGEIVDGDHDDDDRFDDGDFGRGFGRRGGSLFRILFILIPVILVLGLAGLGWLFARRRKAAAQAASNGPPPPPPIESESEDET